MPLQQSKLLLLPEKPYLCNRTNLPALKGFVYLEAACIPLNIAPVTLRHPSVPNILKPPRISLEVTIYLQIGVFRLSFRWI